MPRDRIFHRVGYWQIHDWLAAGWVVLEPGFRAPHLDNYGVTMEWLCDCPMARPREAICLPDAPNTAGIILDASRASVGPAKSLPASVDHGNYRRLKKIFYRSG